jgi:uncharacterized protein (DUF4415 family)
VQKKTPIGKASANTPEARRTQPASQTDLARVRAKTDEELERDIADDPDFRDIPADWFINAQPVVPESKKLFSLRLDNDVLEWFKAHGPGYQTRMNAVLRAYMRASSQNTR